MKGGRGGATEKGLAEVRRRGEEESRAFLAARNLREQPHRFPSHAADRPERGRPRPGALHVREGALRRKRGILRIQCGFARARLAPGRLGGISEGCERPRLSDAIRRSGGDTGGSRPRAWPSFRAERLAEVSWGAGFPTPTAPSVGGARRSGPWSSPSSFCARIWNRARRTVRGGSVSRHRQHTAAAFGGTFWAGPL